MILPSQINESTPPTKEVIPAAAGFMPPYNYAMPRSFEEPDRPLTLRQIEAMLADPAVSSAYYTHKMAVLSGGLKLVSPVKQPAWSKRPNTKETGDKKLTDEEALARDCLEYCQRSWSRLAGNQLPFLWSFLDALAEKTKLAEVTFELAEDGPDVGQLVFKSIDVKPNWAWRYVVDNKLKITGYLAYDPYGGYRVYPPDKFISITWLPRDSDPRGGSILTAARTAWNLKVQAWPQHYRHLVRFGSPSLDMEMAENDTAGKPGINADGSLKNDGSSMPTAVYYTTMLGVFQSGGIIVRPNGSTLNIVEPHTNGDAFQLAVDLYNREIALAIEFSARAMLEAKHGSKADSATGENRKDVGVSFMREWLADAIYPAFKLLVKLRYGDDAAQRFTPRPTFGNAEGANRPELWKSAASLGFKLGPSQMAEMDDELGLPIRDEEADAEATAEAMKAEAELNAPPAANGKPKPDASKPK